MTDARDVTARAPAARHPAQLWIASTYFAEGYPYSIVNNLAEVVFASLGASLGAVGLTSLFHLPWNLKFLWAPFVDAYGTKRRWLLGIEVGLVAMLVAAAFASSSAASVPALSIAFIALALLSATHDVAIDGFYLTALDESEQSRFVGLRQLSYKLANLLVRGPAIVLAGLVGWRLGMLALAALMGAVTLAHVALLPRDEVERRSFGELARWLLRPRVAGAATLLGGLAVGLRSAWPRVASTPIGRVPMEAYLALALGVSLVWLRARRSTSKPAESPYRAAFSGFLAQPRAWVILAFVLLFRTGESFLQKMKWPFLRDALHLSLAEYGIANGTFGVAASFAGTLLGGFLISRHGLRRWIWPFVVAQNGLHLLYVWLAAYAARGAVSLSTITAVICVEHVGEGLGTAVFTVFLMRCCDPEHRAAHMAIVTALMSIGFTVAGMASGYLAEALGFVRYFGFTFVVTIPSMALIVVLPYLDGRSVTRAPAH
ncbi:MAG: MFS transporter [Deltaproteobacteria bacterium]|nr:MFS transporter [Deltaproteobacteria bacterium]